MADTATKTPPKKTTTYPNGWYASTYLGVGATLHYLIPSKKKAYCNMHISSMKYMTPIHEIKDDKSRVCNYCEDMRARVTQKEYEECI